METQTVKAGIIMKDGKPIACILSDDKTRVPTIYSLEKLGFDEVIDLLGKDLAPMQKKDRSWDPDLDDTVVIN